MPTELTTPTLLLVGGARAIPLSSDMTVQALTQAKRRGMRTHVTGEAASLAGTPEVRALADTTSAVDFTRPGNTAEWARDRVAAGDRFDAVFGIQEMAQVSVAETAEAVGAPGNPPEAIRRIRAKDTCRAVLAAEGFPQPAVRLCADQAEAAAFLAETAGPWIVKPRDAMGSIGVSQVFEPAQLPAAIELLPSDDPFLVEEFVDGPEYSVEGFFQNGKPTILAITAKEKVAPPFFVEVGHVLPAELDPAVRIEIEQQVGDALTALGLRFGGFHVELWLTPSGVVLGEVHGRFGGDWIHRMLAHAIPGLELFGAIYDDMLGRADTSGDLRPVRGAAARYMIPPPGRLTAIEGWDEVRAHPAVLYADLTAKVGDRINPVRKSSDRVGVVVVGAETPAAARELASELVSSVRFVVES
ncbi:ATP-grasp domain-containing protein [Streptomyces sp. NPDC006655]|uniref:ATP-grasp domain-containing protein n=1 Tax=Streptomyces sp. NPDC006655 TaxID=3156898 RepID=UPI0034514D72